jgi:hypothetical protein
MINTNLNAPRTNNAEDKEGAEESMNSGKKLKNMF